MGDRAQEVSCSLVGTCKVPIELERRDWSVCQFSVLPAIFIFSLSRRLVLKKRIYGLYLDLGDESTGETKPSPILPSWEWRQTISRRYLLLLDIGNADK
jgi:hypothetical protein